MLKSLAAAAAITGLGLMANGCTSSRPMNQPWCAVMSDAGSSECSYATWEQCEATVSGAGGVCILNPRGPDGGRKRVR